MRTIPLRLLPELCSGTGAVGSAAGGGYGNEKKMLSQAHQKHTLGGKKPLPLNSQQLGRVGSSLEAGKSPPPLPSPDGGG